MVFLYILIAIILIVGFLDGYTTNKALSLGLKEANPIMKWFQDKLGGNWIVIKIALHVAVASVVFYFYTTAPLVAVMATFAIAINTAVVYKNFKIIKKVSK